MISIYIFLTLVILVLFMYLLFEKASVHLRLLKEIYPNELRDINSIHRLMMGFAGFSIIGIKNTLWIFCPIYCSRKKTVSLEGRKMKFHNRLIDLNRYILIIFLFYIFWICIVPLFMGLWG